MNRHFALQAVIEVERSDSLQTLEAAVTSALQAGLRATVLEGRLYALPTTR